MLYSYTHNNESPRQLEAKSTRLFIKLPLLIQRLGHISHSAIALFDRLLIRLTRPHDIAVPLLAGNLGMLRLTPSALLAATYDCRTLLTEQTVVDLQTCKRAE